MIARYHHIVILLLIKWLNRRSQKKSYRDKGFTTMINFFDLPQHGIKVNIYAIWEINTILWGFEFSNGARPVLWGLYGVICAST